MDNPNAPPPTDFESDYSIGYGLGILTDFNKFQRTIADFQFRNADPAELVRGWNEGTLDSWLNALRGDLRTFPDPVRAYLMGAIANGIIAARLALETDPNANNGDDHK